MSYYASNSAARKTILEVVCVATILASGIASYCNTFGVPFLFDDIARIVNEPSIRTVWPPSVAMQNSNRPFGQYTFALNYACHGYDVFGFHFANLGIHLIGALFLYGFVKRSLRRCGPRYHASAPLLAFSIAVVWVVHPLNTQAVTYIVQRLESLMGLAYLATLYCFARSQDSKTSWFWMLCSIVACAFGMGCKEVMVSAPLVVLWYDRAFMASSWRELFRKRKYFYGILTSTWTVLVWSMVHYRLDYSNGSLYQVEGLTSWTYLLSQSSVLVHYLSLAVWPRGQCVYLAWPVSHAIQEVLPQFLFVSALFASTVWAVFHHPRWGFLGGCFFLVLAPTSSVIPIKDLAFEHRMYLPLAAVIALALTGAYELLSRIGISKAYASHIHLGTSILLALALGITAFHRNKVFVSETSVWKDTLVKSPRNVTVWVGLGGLLAKEKKYAEACEHFERALEIAANDPSANANYAGLLIEMKNYELAGQHLERAFQNNPNDLDAIANMAHLQTRLENFAEAVKYYKAAVLGFPNDEELQSSLIASQIRSGSLSQAVTCSLDNLEHRPNSAKANVDYASALIANGRNAEAVAYCERAIALDNQLSTAHATLATLETVPDKAIERMKRAVSLEPLSFDYNRALGDMLMSTMPLEAIGHFEIALQSERDSVEVLLKIGGAWDACGFPEKGIPYLERVTQLLPDWVEARQSLEVLRKRFERP